MYMGHGTRVEEGGGVRPREDKEEPKSKEGGSRREDAFDDNAVVERPCAQVLRGSDRTWCHSEKYAHLAPWIPAASQAECGSVILLHIVIRRSVKLYRPQSRGASIGKRVVLVGQPLLMIMPSVIHSLMPSTVAGVWRIVPRNRSCEKLRKKLKSITKSCT